jgi:hypothetical protein
MATRDGTRDSPAMPETYNLLDALSEVDPEGLEVERTVGEGLILRSPQLGEARGVAVRPCFPVTKSDRFLFFTGAEDEPIGLLADPGALSDESRRALHEELAKQQFLPVITQVKSVSSDFAVPIWDVLTDHGPRRLQLRSSHDVHRMEGGRIYVRDAEGNGYVIPDYTLLDPVSRDLLEYHM